MENNFKDLLERYLNGQCTEAEAHKVEAWYFSLNEAESRVQLSDDMLSAAKERIRTRLPYRKPRKNVIQRHPYLAVAAVLMIIALAGIGFLFLPARSIKPVATVTTPIVPGGNKAVLTLANGQELDLTSASEGDISKEGNITMRKTAAGELAISGTATHTGNNNIQYNEISIPRGGQWKMTLGDGTQVWLNAATRLKFPTSFTTATRDVFIEGEAYFQVAKDKAHPFKVHSAKQVIEVLGTSFNVNAYEEEGHTITTLLEGSVKLNDNISLKPGQQAFYDGNKIDVHAGDIEQAVAWKEGISYFSEEELPVIMRQISRWYNVEVEFQSDQLKKITFSGSFSRSANIQTLLHQMSLTREASFSIQGNKIVISPYH